MVCGPAQVCAVPRGVSKKSGVRIELYERVNAIHEEVLLRATIFIWLCWRAVRSVHDHFVSLVADDVL